MLAASAMKSSWLVVPAAIATVSLACSDSSSPATPTSAPSSANDDTARVVDSGADGGGEICVYATPRAANRACVPPGAKAAAPITIDITASSPDCLGCGEWVEPCSVKVEGTAITVGMRTSYCRYADDRPITCTLDCKDVKSVCTLPALPAGAYEVRVEGEPPASSPRILYVTAEATATSCHLSASYQPPPGPGELDLTSFDKTCTTDTDCLAVVVSTCTACTCPTRAIAKSAKAAYDAAYAAATSQCAPVSPVACGACEEKHASCNTTSHVCEL